MFWKDGRPDICGVKVVDSPPLAGWSASVLETVSLVCPGICEVSGVCADELKGVLLNGCV